MEFPDIGLWEWFRTNAMPWFKTLLEAGIRAFFFQLRFWFTLSKAFLVAICGIVVASVWALNKLEQTLSSINLETVVTPVATMLQYYAFMNRFLPLSEGFAGAVICFDVWLGFTIFRWIKSFVPTLSN